MIAPRFAAILALTIATAAHAQRPLSATYITDEEVKAVLATPGIDHTIRVVDIGNENFAIGIIHRGPTAAPAATGAGAGGRATPAASPCGDQLSPTPADAIPGAITHDSQTEGYYIVSGGGTLVTGGRIVNGNRSGPDAPVTKELNGPSCSGLIAGPGVVSKMVKPGDIIIIPAGVPHGWTAITDHVDYLSFRPSDHVLQAGYVHPAIRR
jgi:mannose-6-phosphate isomerase-like protein (cupin superfamily)